MFLDKHNGDWGLGIGDWDWGLGIGPNPQSPIPNPQSPIPNPHLFLRIHLKNYLNYNKNIFIRYFLFILNDKFVNIMFI